MADRSGLRTLLPHTTLIQSFDTARFHEEDRSEEQDRVNLARTEVLLNILYGREVILPAGQIAESPAVTKIFGEVMGAYERHQKNIPARSRWKPFRIALEPQFHDYQDYVAKYEDVGAPMATLPLGEQRKAEERSKQLQYLKKLFLEGQFDQLGKAVGRDDYAEFSRLVSGYFDGQSAVRPLKHGVPEGSADFLSTMRNRIDKIPEEKRNIDALPEIQDTLNFFSGLKGERNFRGVWYANRERFGESWELARVWLDQALYFTLAQKYGVEHPVYVSQDLTRGRFDPQVVLGYESTPDTDFKRPDVPSVVAKVPEASWGYVWDLLTDDDFHYSVEKMTTAINNAQWDKELDIAVHEHTKFLNQCFSDIAFDLRNGCFVLDVKKKPSSFHRIAGSVAASAVTAGAAPLLLNSFVPGSYIAAQVISAAFTTLAGGTAHQVINHCSQWFYRRRQNKLFSSNKAVLTGAQEVVNYWTKPVMDVGELARARSAQLSGPNG